LHQHHELNEKFSIGGIHYTVEKRKEKDERTLSNYKAAGFTLSTSVHSLEEYHELSGSFDYCFFGPVFNSISKKNYDSVIKDDFRLNKNKEVELIAIGGINEDNIEKTEKMGFSGVALLGAIWMNENPLEKYLQIKKVCQKNQYMY
jgi:thiamine-phosphate pyrophosphorylase